MKGKNKILFQSSVIAIATAAAAFFFISHAEEKPIQDLWKIYQKLSYEAKFSLGILTVGAAYFGGALYVGNIVVHQIPTPASNSSSSSSTILQTPSTEAVSEPFEIPEKLPEDDKVFFESMLERYEIKYNFSLLFFFFSLLYLNLIQFYDTILDLLRKFFKI